MTAAAIALAGLAAVTAAPSGAHSTLVGSCPGQEEVVSELTEIRLTFGSPLEAPAERPPTVALATLDGTDFDIGATELVDAVVLRAAVPEPPPPGQYVVRYEVLSVDGDLNDGGFLFTYDPDAGDATNCRDDSEGSGAGGWILLGGGVVGVAVLAAILFVRPRMRSQEVSG